MKIRSDFVSNSSSSSFIICADVKYDNRKVAEDFVDFAFNIGHKYLDWENYLAEKLDQSHNSINAITDMPIEKDELVKSIRSSYEFDKNIIERDTSPERMRYKVEKLLDLFSVDKGYRTLFLPWPYRPSIDYDNVETIDTGKLSKEEKQELLNGYDLGYKEVMSELADLEKLTNDEFINITHDSTDKRCRKYRCYGTRTRMIESLDFTRKDMERIRESLSALYDNIDSQNVYVIRVANGGDGEDDDSIYAFMSDRNYEWLADGKYCFSIANVEVL